MGIRRCSRAPPWKEKAWSNHQIDMPNPNVSIPVTGKGRYIKIQLDGENYLSLAEVQVYGK